MISKIIGYITKLSIVFICLSVVILGISDLLLGKRRLANLDDTYYLGSRKIIAALVIIACIYLLLFFIMLVGRLRRLSDKKNIKSNKKGIVITIKTINTFITDFLNSIGGVTASRIKTRPKGNGAAITAEVKYLNETADLESVRNDLMSELEKALGIDIKKLKLKVVKWDASKESKKKKDDEYFKEIEDISEDIE